MIPGWPSCAKEGCPWPAVLKVRMQNETGEFFAHLCVVCVTEVRKCLSTLVGVIEADRQLLEASAGDFEKADITRIGPPEVKA